MGKKKNKAAKAADTIKVGGEFSIAELLERLGMRSLAIPTGDDRLAEVIAWLIDQGAPRPSITDELVTYPGGSYQNKQAIFEANGKRHNVDIGLMAQNPTVTLTELRVAGIAPGDPRSTPTFVPKSIAVLIPVPTGPHPSGDTLGILGDKWFDAQGLPGPEDDVYFPGPNDSHAPGTSYTPVAGGLTWVKFGPTSPFDRPKWIPARSAAGARV